MCCPPQQDGGGWNDVPPVPKDKVTSKLYVMIIGDDNSGKSDLWNKICVPEVKSNAANTSI